MAISTRNEEPKIDWEALRRSEAALAQSLKYSLVPGLITAQTRSTWEADYVGRYLDADAAQYDYKARNFFFKSKIVSRLTLYSTADIGRQAVVRVYDLNLRPGHERLDVIPARATVSEYGVDADIPWHSPKESKFIERAGLQLPNQEDYEIVREQLARGAGGCFPLRPPIDT